MDPGVRRVASWWGTLVLALALVFVGTFGYIWIGDDLEWLRTDVVDPRDVSSMKLGKYVRIEGTVAMNTTEDVIVVQHEVEKATTTAYEYEYTVAWAWIEDDNGNSVLVLFDHVTQTKPGRHDGNYHKGDTVCIGGSVAEDGSGIKRVRAHMVAKHQNDTVAIYWQFFVGAIIIGLILVLLFGVTRLFLKPRKMEAPDWRGT
jgi:hypothetical protein